MRLGIMCDASHVAMMVWMALITLADRRGFLCDGVRTVPDLCRENGNDDTLTLNPMSCKHYFACDRLNMLRRFCSTWAFRLKLSGYLWMLPCRVGNTHATRNMHPKRSEKGVPSRP